MERFEYADARTVLPAQQHPLALVVNDRLDPSIASMPIRRGAAAADRRDIKMPRCGSESVRRGAMPRLASTRAGNGVYPIDQRN